MKAGILKQSTRMTMEELRDELDAMVMTLGTSRDIVVLAEAVSRLITLAQPKGEQG